MKTRQLLVLSDRAKLIRFMQVVLCTGLLALHIPMQLSAQETPEEWAAAAQQYLSEDPPEYYNAADAYVYAGEAALDLEDYDGAEDYFNEALNISLPRNFHSISARAYDGLGKVESERGNFSQALEYHLEAASKYLEDDDFMGAGWAYIDAGSAAYENGDVSTAVSWLEEAAMTFLRGDYYTNAGFSYIFIAWIMLEEEDFEQAIDYYLEAVDISIEGEVYLNAAVAYKGAGYAAKGNKDCTLALEYWTKAQEYYAMIGESFTIPSCGLEIIIENPEESSTFGQGEPVVLQGRVEYAGNQVVPVQSAITYELVVPECNTPQAGRKKIASTDDEGNFSVMSFAGWNMGEYELVVKANYYSDAEQKQVSATSTASFNVIRPETEGAANQIHDITEIYYQTIPEGPIRTNPEAQQYLNDLYETFCNQEFSEMFSEDEYGSLHNIWLADTEYDDRSYYTCAGYQAQVLQMFDLMRFHEDINTRNLLRGLDYAPIYRGYNFGREWWYHVAVVLYRIGEDWKTDPHATVFDPWFQQKPAVYTMEEWCLEGAWGINPWNPEITPSYLEVTDLTKEIWTGFPLTGNVICSSFNAYTSEPVKKLNYKITVKCPVTLLVTDSLGNRMGVLPDDSFVQELPGIVYCSTEGEEINGWYIELPDYTYDLTITGESDGEFEITITGEGVEDKYLYYGLQPIAEDEQATIHLGPGILRPDLFLPDGTVIEPMETGSTDRNDPVLHDGGSLMNYPNPFDGQTQISFVLSERTFVTLDIYNATGQLIRTLLQEHKSPGQHHVIWDGKNHEGWPVKSGVYFFRITTSTGSKAHKMIVAKE